MWLSSTSFLLAFMFNWKVHKVFAVLENTHRDIHTKGREKGECSETSEEAEPTPNRTEEGNGDQSRGPRAVSYGQRSTNIFLKWLHISFLYNLKSNHYFFPTFFCLKNNFCRITNYTVPSTGRSAKDQVVSVATPCTENVSIKHCICPETALNQRSE